MSRIGKAPIELPSNVKVTVSESNEIHAKGPKGELRKQLHKDMLIKVEKDHIVVNRPSDDRKHKALHGLTRTLVNNVVQGVSNGFVRELHLIGVGYKVAKQGKGIQIICGYSHPVNIEPISGIEFDVVAEKALNKIIISGIDKELVGQVAADIRYVKPPEPYKGKGIKYSDEVIIKKMGKAGKAGK